MSLLSKRVEVAVVVRAPVGRVWESVSDLTSHGEWMADVASIHVESPGQRGPGTRLLVDTRIGPFRTTDVLEVTEWVECRAIGVRHHGLVSGTGRFELAPVAGGTRFLWREDLDFPWWLGNGLTARLAKPVLAAVWRGNVRRLKRRVEGETGSGLSDP